MTHGIRVKSMKDSRVRWRLRLLNHVLYDTIAAWQAVKQKATLPIDLSQLRHQKEMAVTILESCMVTPSEETPRHGLWLSNLDLLVARNHTTPVLAYRPGHGPASCFSPDVLKASLSKALVPFYPLAGRLAEDRTGRQEIRCTGDGVLFVAARVDATLDEMGDLVPSDEMRRMLCPSADGEHAGVLVLTQATFFKCGAVCMGTSLHRLTADGRAFANFLNAWAAIARGVCEAGVPRPWLDRTLLRARSPPAVRFDHTDVYSWRGGGGAKPKVPFEAAILPISRSQVDALKGSAQVAKVDSIISGSLGATTNRVSDAIAVLNDEFIRSLVDYAELATSDAEAAAGLRIQEWKVIPETDLWVVSWLGLTFSEVDFGWGRPAFIRPATIRGRAVFLIPSPGGLDVAAAMEPERLARFKELFYEGLQRHSTVSPDMHAAKRSKL
ncbi:hypothetical protein EJB05_45929, partial [Eragrostis curvula]